MIKVALLGNPNVGKTSVFNALSGARQRVGNWPGVTVDKKVGRFFVDAAEVEVTDLPGTAEVLEEEQLVALDRRIARNFLFSGEAETVINVVDATRLDRALYLTTQLLTLGVPVVVALNMSDRVRRLGMEINTRKLAERLGCEVVSICAIHGDGIEELKTKVAEAAQRRRQRLLGKKESSEQVARFECASARERYALVDSLLEGVIIGERKARSLTHHLDGVLLNGVLALPLFLMVVYLMFFITISVGGAFIDFFDGVGDAIFVEGSRWVFSNLYLPPFLVAFLADGVGGGIQLVGTFIPVIGTLFLCLSFLEGSGYMARAAFLMDRMLRRVGLPGHAFLPLIVGFGCNVPAVMATRNLPGNSERVMTAIMAPYMSCGARLTVYALFAAAFFRGYATEIVFLLYLIGILVAVVTVLLMRGRLVTPPTSGFVLEMPAYHRPRLGNLLHTTWHRLRDFVVRAGKAIVLVVIVLNLLSSWGTDGSFGNEDSENSVLSAIGKEITPILRPMGVKEENWPAAVGLFTGMFAKEVVVGTFDALYSGPEADKTGGELASSGDQFDFWGRIREAAATVPENLSGLGSEAVDPLALGQVEQSAEGERVIGKMTTVERLRDSFSGDLAAFSYLLFILLYVPCVATVGVIFRELGGFWATFSVAWSLTLAYGLAVVCFQVGTWALHPLESLVWILGMFGFMAVVYVGFVQWGLRGGVDRDGDLIPLREIG